MKYNKQRIDRMIADLERTVKFLRMLAKEQKQGA